ncbi:MAG TPA: bifunctional hydroxymethylpyrimidine kinase/phosphomethylpyrimidine kinase [Nitrososphaera sp.]|nr:bifunctional hydroxymethylpyrimidine kinase/phosphomethylpyrimidine kinase [Nitrososphaera sp.]
MKIALSVAGSDSGAGAGIQADIKTFSALGVYGCTAITAITAQNTRGVSEILEVSPRVIEQQISSLMNDMPPDAVKIGMVYSSQTIEVVYRSLKKSRIPIVLDPILAAGTGAKLLRDDAIDSFVSKLIPLCTLITPNRMEAERLADMKIRSKEDGIDAARRIKKLGAQNVVVKGGHTGTLSVTDLLLDIRGRVTEITNPRVMIKESHGSGCNFSSAVTAYLAKGFSLHDACRAANEYVYTAIKNAVRIGKGLPVTNPLSAIYRDAQRYQVISELQAAVEQVVALDGFYRLIPETQTNFVYALPDATEASEVAGVRGRIVRVGNSAVPSSYIEFGASRHMASAVIGYMRVNPAFRSVINIRFADKLIKICKSLFSVSSYDRSKEPLRTKRKEGSSVLWGTMQALSKNPNAEVIFHRGDIGKEPMITIFGKSPNEVAAKVRVILKNY